MPYFECCKPIVFRFAGEILEAEGRARGGQPTRAAEARRAKKKCGPDRDSGATVRRANLTPRVYALESY